MTCAHDTALPFTPSGADSVGMEMEVQLLDPQSLDLVDGVRPLLELYPGSPCFKPEFIQNTFEIASPVCHSLNELHDSVQVLMAELLSHCRELGMALCGAGTHPFSERLALITPLPRYHRMAQEAGYLSQTQITFATHVHVGMTSGDEAITLMRELKPYLPLLIALSASSPFWRGYDTGYASYRQRILAAGRSYGNPPAFADWKSFAQFLQNCNDAAIFDSINDIHWDIRPRPHLGTLEMRVMDAQSTVTDAIRLAALVRSLVSYLRQTPMAERPPSLPQSLPWWFEKENHFQASRYGLQAHYIHSEQGAVSTVREVSETVLAILIEFSAGSDAQPWLSSLQAQLEQGVQYEQQRACYSGANDFRRVVDERVKQLVADTYKQRDKKVPATFSKASSNQHQA